MELDSTTQVSAEHLNNQYFDVYLAVSGNESRCTCLLDKADMRNFTDKVALSFVDKKKSHLQEQNNNRFKESGFTLIEVSSSNASMLADLLNPICGQHKRDYLNILIDYSCMPQVWYNEIINYFIRLEEKFSNVNLWFAYSPAVYNELQKTSKTFNYQNIKDHKQDKPLALIVGLGLNKGQAEELAHKLLAKTIYTFYPDPYIDSRYVKDLQEHHKSFLKKIDNSKIITYPLSDLNSTNSLLTALCVNLRLKYKIVLASEGPKTFSLLSYILSARYPDITIWNVNAGTDPATDRKPTGDLLLYKAEFTSEEVDY